MLAIITLQRNLFCVRKYTQTSDGAEAEGEGGAEKGAIGADGVEIGTETETGREAETETGRLPRPGRS